jgi:hypothetical protein
METNTHKKLVILVSALVLAIVLLSGRDEIAHPTQAQQRNTTTQASTQQWEYCAITGTEASSKGGAAVIHYFHSGEVQRERIDYQARASDYPLDPRSMAAGKAVAKLGTEGWEMVGNGALSSAGHQVLYFKRARK